MVEVPALKLQRKVKSIQMFKRPVESASQGDRVGMCVTQFDPALLERGLAATPDVVPTFSTAIVSTTKIKYFKQAIKRNTKFHGKSSRFATNKPIYSFLSFFTQSLWATAPSWQPHIFSAPISHG